jgi:hypothetical protein
MVRRVTQRMTAAEERSEQMRPYRALFAAIIHQAVDDVKHAGLCDRSQAAHWLMRSEGSRELFEFLDIDPAWIRAELRKQPWIA